MDDNSNTKLITYKDMQGIISGAKRIYSEQTVPMSLSGKEVEHGELPSIALTHALIRYLTQNNLLTKELKVDYTDPSNVFDSE